MTLDPLRAAALGEATARADAILAEAAEQARARLARADAAAAALVERARHDGAAAAELTAAHGRARARGDARALVLAERSAIYERVRQEAAEAVLRLRDAPEYSALLERLAAKAHAQLGEGAEVDVGCPEIGGVVGRAGSRSVNYTLPALVERCIAELGTQIEALWE